MVKNEVDIIEYWIKYHGSLFGYNNLFIVDNMSNDGTYEIMEFYKNYGIHIFREVDYTKKGEIMTHLIKQEQNYSIAFPLDIDEFIVYYNKEENKINPQRSVKYLQTLIQSNMFDQYTIFKANYIQTLLFGTTDGYKNAFVETKHGKYQNYGSHAKTFLNVSKWDGVLDHGNHCPSEQYLLSDLCLVHYHCRNKEQMIKKVENNVQGLGYPINDLEYLQSLDKHCPGSHHVKHMIDILQNNFQIPTVNQIHNCISLQPMIKYSKELNIIP